MNKKFKKISSVALCAAMLTVVAPSVTSFADSITPGKSVHAEYKSEKRKITGTIDLSDYVLVEGVATTEDGNKIFKGNIVGEICSHDLIEDAYQAYLKNFKGQTLLSGPAENLVMFGAGYIEPFATLKLSLPEGAKIYKDAFLANSHSNTSAISKIYHRDGEAENILTIVFNLGTWNDYATFFTNYEKERNDPSKTVRINIPFTYGLSGNTYSQGDIIGNVKAKGECKLYYGGRFKSFYKAPIVDINTRDFTKDILYK